MASPEGFRNSVYRCMVFAQSWDDSMLSSSSLNTEQSSMPLFMP